MHCIYRFPTILIVKGKAVPLQARSGPEGSRKLVFPDFMTTAQDGLNRVAMLRSHHHLRGFVYKTL